MDYPKFFELDDQLIVVTEEEGEVIGRSVPSGKVFPALRAINEGEELGRDRFIEKMKQLVPAATLAAMTRYF